MENIITVKNLKTYFYANNRCNKALNGVSMEIKRGKTLCIVGESGCGKSVTASSIMQLLPKFSRIEEGEIIYHSEDGKDIEIHKLEKNSKEMRRLRGKDIAMIFQDPMTALNPVYTIGWQIVEMIRSHENISKKEAKERALKLLKDMGIPLAEKRIDQYPHEFSGGMRQRAMIAMAMSCNPKVLIADEPTTALDVTIQAQILKLINRLKYEMNSSVLLITHDMGVISEMADNVIVMYAGKIVEYTSVNDLFKNPLHPYTVGLMKSIPDIDSDSEEELEVIPGSVPMLYELPEGCFFAPRCKYAKDLCHKKCPAMIDVGDGHLVRCWKYHEEWQKGDK